MTRQYRLDGARERITHPDSNYFQASYTTTGQRLLLWRNATSGTPVTQVAYDTLNRPSNWYGDAGTVATRVQQNFTYDSALRLDELFDGVAGTANDLTIGMSYNPAWQSAQRALSNDNYVYDEAVAGTTGYTPDGLNRYSNVNPPGAGSITPTYDARGNLISYGADSFAYDSLNRLTSATVGGQTTAFSYDPLGRLFRIDAPGTADDRRLLSDGASVIAQYGGTGATVLGRFYHDQGSLGAPHVQYAGSGVTLADQRYFLTDEQGSVIGIALGSTGQLAASNSYGPYGEPAAGNQGLYQYAGQVWIAQAGLQYMRNRWYHPGLGRFMQTDPIGYQGGMNLYAYVGNDPVNVVDPWGLESRCGPEAIEEICVLGKKDRGENWQDVLDFVASIVSNVAGVNPYEGVGAPITVRACQGNNQAAACSDRRRRRAGSSSSSPVVRGQEEAADPCQIALTRAGRVEVTTVDFTGIIAIGGTAGIGRFRNVTTGDTGYFWTAGPGGGLDIGFSASVGSFNSLRALNGFAETGNLNLPGLGGFAAPSGSVSRDLDGNVIGETGAASVGPPAPRAGASGTFTETGIFGCTLG